MLNQEDTCDYQDDEGEIFIRYSHMLSLFFLMNCLAYNLVRKCFMQATPRLKRKLSDPPECLKIDIEQPIFEDFERSRGDSPNQEYWGFSNRK